METKEALRRAEALGRFLDLYGGGRSIEQPTGWKCTGYTHGCFCPTCDQRDIARAEFLNAQRAARHG